MYYKIYPTIAKYYKLQGAKKDLFFLINSYRENKQPFYASVQHIADVININRRNVYPLLKELIEEKLIEKIENGLNFTYQICDETSQKCDELSQIEIKHLNKSEMIHLKKCDVTSQNGDETSQKCDETSPNIKVYKSNNLIDNYAASEFRNRIEYLQFLSAYKETYNRTPRLNNEQLASLAYIVANDSNFKSNLTAVFKYIKGQKYYDSTSIFKDGGEKYFCILAKIQENKPDTSSGDWIKELEKKYGEG